MSDDTISGFVGLVLVPGPETLVAARMLAAAIVSAGAESVLDAGALPHVTLTQCPLREAPRAPVSDLIARLERRLIGANIPLSPLVVFGGGFVFWCVEPTASERSVLQAAHEEALALADGGLDPVANADVVAATIKLTAGDPALVANARRHGYAFVRERYLPHITLGFDSRLTTGATLAESSRPHAMRVTRVALARLGRYGVVQSVIELPRA